MTDLKSQILAACALREEPSINTLGTQVQRGYAAGAKTENARLMPVLLALIDVAETLRRECWCCEEVPDKCDPCLAIDKLTALLGKGE